MQNIFDLAYFKKSEHRGKVPAYYLVVLTVELIGRTSMLLRNFHRSSNCTVLGYGKGTAKPSFAICTSDVKPRILPKTAGPNPLVGGTECGNFVPEISTIPLRAERHEFPLRRPVRTWSYFCLPTVKPMNHNEKPTIQRTNNQQSKQRSIRKEEPTNEEREQ